MQPLPRVLRQGRRLRIAEDLQCLPSGVHHQPAILAASQVFLDRRLQAVVQRVVEIVRKFLNDVPAPHDFLLLRKTRLSFVRSFSRALSSLDFTAGTESPSASAVSSVDSPSMSRN